MARRSHPTRRTLAAIDIASFVRWASRTSRIRKQNEEGVNRVTDLAQAGVHATVFLFCPFLSAGYTAGDSGEEGHEEQCKDATFANSGT